MTHPRRQRTWIQRLNWSPLVVALPLGFFVYRSATAGFTPMRTIGLCVGALWFGMAVFDWRTRGRLTDWIYGDCDAPTPPSDV